MAPHRSGEVVWVLYVYISDAIPAFERSFPSGVCIFLDVIRLLVYLASFSLSPRAILCRQYLLGHEIADTLSDIASFSLFFSLVQDRPEGALVALLFKA